MIWGNTPAIVRELGFWCSPEVSETTIDASAAGLPDGHTNETQTIPGIAKGVQGGR